MEQPSGSVLEFYLAWRHIMQYICHHGGPWSVTRLSNFVSFGSPGVPISVWYFQLCRIVVKDPQFCSNPIANKVSVVKWWMAHYGAPTAKRHWGSTRIHEASNGTKVPRIYVRQRYLLSWYICSLFQLFLFLSDTVCVHRIVLPTQLMNISK